ncbi:TRAP transporter substrate-binding protein [Alteribacter keqinensis]|uniref:TRAP transporter substrate-binding protein n=1 Tax=Alteribacter keqinensis TaxID=2483800 RepID=A0A3M7TXY8_9BACI|nr:TRAP transporter substrate-binding protein [Alteribacter keqinensis]RNA70139.1 TRAP transporter substrate-binding protein [Alteribacter keqinensis]
MKKTFLGTVSGIALTWIIVGCGNEEAASGSEEGDGTPHVLDLATVVTAPHPWIDMAEYFAEEVEEKTGGDVEVRIHHTGTLGDDEGSIDEMRLGTVDFVIGGTQNAAPFLREYQLFSLSYLFEDMGHFQEAIAHDSELTEEFRNLHDERDLGFKLLAFAGGGTRNLANSIGPIEEPEDIAGLQLRLPDSPLESKIWSELGAVPTSLPWNEIYSAVQTGVVDGFESTLSGFKGSNLNEVTDYLSVSEHQFMVSHFSMSTLTYEQLPEEYAEIIEQVAVESGYIGTENGIEYDEEILDELESLGMEVNEVNKDAFIEILQPLHEELAEDIGASELLDMIQNLNHQ